MSIGPLRFAPPSVLLLVVLAACGGGNAEIEATGGTQSGGSGADSSSASGGSSGGSTGSGGEANGVGGKAGTGGWFIDFPLGDPCTDDSECPPIGDSGYISWCKNNWPGGACTSNCSGPEHCGPDNSCGSGGCCVKKCEADQDCRDGYYCTEDFWELGCQPDRRP